MRVVMIVTHEDHKMPSAGCFATLGGAMEWLKERGFSLRVFAGSTADPQWVRPLMHDTTIEALADPDFQPEWMMDEWEFAEVFETEVGP